MNNEEKILAILETMYLKQDRTEKILESIQSDITSLKQGQARLEQRQTKLEQRQNDLKTDFQELKEQQHETHNNLISLENMITPKINALYETRFDLTPRVEKLENTVEKLKFGSEVIRLVEMIEKHKSAS